MAVPGDFQLLTLAKLLQNTYNRDTYPSKRYAKWSLATSNTEKRNEFGSFSSQMLSGGRYPQNDQKIKVLRMEFSIVENLSGPQGSIFILFRGPYLNSRTKSKKYSNFIKFPDFPLFPLFGVYRWSHGADAHARS